ETRYLEVGTRALSAALADASIDTDRVDVLIVAGTHGRACKAVARRSGVDGTKVLDDRAATIGNPGAAQPALLLADALDRATPGQVIVLLTLADGADALVFRTTEAIAAFEPERTVADQAASG